MNHKLESTSTENDINKVIIPVKATLKKDVEYNKDEEMVTVEKGTKILIDTELSIAVRLDGKGDHFAVFPGEYEITFPH